MGNPLLIEGENAAKFQIRWIGRVIKPRLVPGDGGLILSAGNRLSKLADADRIAITKRTRAPSGPSER